MILSTGLVDSMMITSAKKLVSASQNERRWFVIIIKSYCNGNPPEWPSGGRILGITNKEP
jgi:hypothetical protein